MLEALAGTIGSSAAWICASCCGSDPRSDSGADSLSESGAVSMSISVVGCTMTSSGVDGGGISSSAVDDGAMFSSGSWVDARLEARLDCLFLRLFCRIICSGSWTCRACGSSELERSWRGSDEVARARLDLRTPAVGGTEALLATFEVRLGAILKSLTLVGDSEDGTEVARSDQKQPKGRSWMGWFVEKWVDCS